MLHYNTSPFMSKLLLFDVHYAGEPLIQSLCSSVQLRTVALHYKTSPFMSKLLLFDVHYAAEPLNQSLCSSVQLRTVAVQYNSFYLQITIFLRALGSGAAKSKFLFWFSIKNCCISITISFSSKLLLFYRHYAAEPLNQSLCSSVQ